MMLTLLIWSYAQGVRSSRRIERLCHQDIALRIICGGNLPDHVAVARFRAEFAEAVKDLFTEVLVLCARLGMGSLATITLDGTKVAANASRSANRSRQWLAEQAARVVDEHAATDAEQDVLWGPGSCPDRVPADLFTDDEQDEHPGGQPTSAGGDAGKGGGDDSPARARGRAGRAARIAAAVAQTQAEDAERAQRQHAADAERAAAAQEYLKAQAGGAQGTGRPPQRARLQAARARLARLQAQAAGEDRVVEPSGGPGPRRRPAWADWPWADLAAGQRARAPGAYRAAARRTGRTRTPAQAAGPARRPG